MRRLWSVVALSMATADLVLAAAACGAGTEGSADGRVLTVWAAASLTEAFAEIGAEFEREHPGAQVRFSFGPSDGLATQIIEGAPADVYASASPKWMDAVARDGPGVTDRIDFARNSLMLITPLDDPAEIRSLQDLARPGVKLVLAAEGVPAGDYARRVLAQAGIAEAAEANVVSNEEDVKGVVQKVLLGEADAGLVYRTDVTPAVASRLIALDIPPELNVSAIYPIAVVAGSSQPELARAFVALVMAEGREALMDAGFSTARPAPD